MCVHKPLLRRTRRNVCLRLHRLWSLPCAPPLSPGHVAAKSNLGGSSGPCTGAARYSGSDDYVRPRSAPLLYAGARPGEGTQSSTTADVAKEQEEDVRTENKAPWQRLAETLKRLPLRVEMLPGRGRNRTGPTEQWEPKKKRHDPCARKTKLTEKASERREDPTDTDAAKQRTEKKRKMPRAFAKGLLTEEVLQQLHEERQARRDAFDAFTTTLQHSRRKRVRFAAKTNAASTPTTLSKDQDAPPPAPAAATNKNTKRTKADRRFCIRNARRGKAATSTRPCCTYDWRDADQLERMNLGAPSEAYVIDGTCAIKVLKMGLPDAVVWNIGEAKAGGLKDRGAGEWKQYVCLEAAAIGKPVKVEPKASWAAGQTFTAMAAADVPEPTAPERPKADRNRLWISRVFVRRAC